MELVSAPCNSNPRASTQDAVARIQRLIRRKRSEKERLEREIDALQRELLAKLAKREELVQLHAEIRRLFATAMTLPRLRKRQRTSVRQLYQELIDQGILWTEFDDESADNAMEDDCPCPYCQAQRDSSSQWGSQGTADTTASWDDTASSRATPAAEANTRPSSVRRLYHDLALRFHPDRAATDEQRVQHESVMRDVNSAYHEGDTERLLELCRELGLDLDQVRAADGVLAELVQQYELLKNEVRALRRSFPFGQMVVATRRARRRDYPSPMDELEAEIQLEFENARAIRELVQQFVAGRITLREFLRGPAIDDDDDDAFPDTLAEMVALLQQLAGEDTEPTRQPKRKRPRKNKRP